MAEKLFESTVPHDFEITLRKVVFDAIDVTTIRNDDGHSLLHSAAINNRLDFLYPIFRTGCWKDLHPLTVKEGIHEGKTADEICTILRRKSFQKHMDIITSWEKSMNAMHLSARSGRWMEYSDQLPHELDEMGCNSLYWAVVGGNLAVVHHLIEHGVDHNLVNSRGETILHMCCSLGHDHLIETLVGKLKMDVKIKNDEKMTPLCLVAKHGDVKTLEKLVQYGSIQSLLGSMVSRAGQYGRLDFIKCVVSRYDTDPQSKDDESGKSAFLRAAEQNRKNVLEYFFESERLNYQETDIRHRNILHAAAFGADCDTIEYIITQRNVVDMINARDKFVGDDLCMLLRGTDKGRESWHYVQVDRRVHNLFVASTTQKNTVDITKYGVTIKSGWGIDPDREARAYIDNVLQARRVAINQDFDCTPLHIAIFKAKYDVAKILVKHGSDVNARDKFGQTPLHIAAMRGDVDFVKLLVQHGACAQKLDTLIKTPADVARDNKHDQLASILESMTYLPTVKNFTDKILPDARTALVTVHDSGDDVRNRAITILRDLTISINETLYAFKSGPIHEEST